MTPFQPRSSIRTERRQHPRLDVDAAAVLIDGVTALRGRIDNIGPAGAAFVTTELEPAIPVGARVTLVAPGAGDAGAALEAHARVLRVDEYLGAAGESRAYALGFDQPLDA